MSSWWSSPKPPEVTEVKAETPPTVRRLNSNNNTNNLDSSLWHSYISHTGANQEHPPRKSSTLGSDSSNLSSSSHTSSPSSPRASNNETEPIIHAPVIHHKASPNQSGNSQQQQQVMKRTSNPLLYVGPTGVLLVLLVFNNGTIQTTASLLLITTILAASVYFAQKLGTGLALAGGILVGQLMTRLNFSIWWYPVWCLLICSSTLLLQMWMPKSSFEKNAMEIGAGRQWLSLLLHGVIKHASPYKVPQFDIGDTLPKFSTRETQILKDGEGFSMIVDFEYKADTDTKIEIEIPMEVPIIGTWTVPVMVSSPHIAGTVHVDVRTLNQVLADKSTVKLFAVALLFEPIKEIHIGNVHVSVASQFALLQYVPLIKDQMKKGVNLGLAPGTRRVLIFDASFGSLGSFNIPEKQQWDVKTLLKKAHIESPPAEPMQVPVLDLVHADPPARPSPNLARNSLADSMIFASPNDVSVVLGSTELEADIPPELEPGEAKEFEAPNDDSRYPKISF